MGKSMFADAPGNLYGHGIINLGTVAAIASGGANARPNPVGFVAFHDMRLLSVWKHNLSASEVTVGTATSSASYRRHRILNGGTAGSATTIIASLNATSSAPASGARSFTVDTAVTIARGEVVYYDQLTVGAATADGTDSAACGIQAAYQLL
jgi:hypothetical protein